MLAAPPQRYRPVRPRARSAVRRAMARSGGASPVTLEGAVRLRHRARSRLRLLRPAPVLCIVRTRLRSDARTERETGTPSPGVIRCGSPRRRRRCGAPRRRIGAGLRPCGCGLTCRGLALHDWTWTWGDGGARGDRFGAGPAAATGPSATPSMLRTRPR